MDKIDNCNEYIRCKIADFIRKGIRQSLSSSLLNAYKLSSSEITNKITRLIEYLLWNKTMGDTIKLFK